MAARENQNDLSPPGNVVADGGPIEAASFVAGAVAELAQLSRRHKLDMLAYLLDMAQLEADDIVRLGITSGKL